MVLGKALPQIKKLTKRPLILGRSFQLIIFRNKIYKDLKIKILCFFSNLKFDCCYEDLSRG